jgi:DNA-directed RNA polymerase subunit RPC12/RpoP
MKYVCDRCGKQLPVDRDVDEDSAFEAVLDSHRGRECPGEFLNESQWGTSPQTQTVGWK